jgi:hypothetical protein
VIVSSVPFILGFTACSSSSERGAAAIGSVVSGNARTEIAGFVLVVLRARVRRGLLPVPERIIGAGLLTGARRAWLGAHPMRCVRRLARRAVHRQRPWAPSSSLSQHQRGRVLKGRSLLAAYAARAGCGRFVGRRGRVRAGDGARFRCCVTHYKP